MTTGQRQDTERECVCRKEITTVVDTNNKSSENRHIAVPECITQNLAFVAV